MKMGIVAYSCSLATRMRSGLEDTLGLTGFLNIIMMVETCPHHLTAISDLYLRDKAVTLNRWFPNFSSIVRAIKYSV